MNLCKKEAPNGPQFKRTMGGPHKMTYYIRSFFLLKSAT